MIIKTEWSFVYRAATQIKWKVHVQYFRWQNLNPLLLFLTCQVFLASKYVEKLMEMTFMFKNTRGSYTWYPSNMEVMLLPRHQRVDVSSSKKREYLRKFRMNLLEGTSVTIALTIWRRKAFQKRGGEKDTCTNTIGKEIWKITITNLGMLFPWHQGLFMTRCKLDNLPSFCTTSQDRNASIDVKCQRGFC